MPFAKRHRGRQANVVELYGCRGRYGRVLPLGEAHLPGRIYRNASSWDVPLTNASLILRGVPEGYRPKSLLFSGVHCRLHFGFDFGVEGFVGFQNILRGITPLGKLGAFVAHP